MLTSRDIKVLHIEPTDVCQAACPLCARETDINFQKHQQHHLTISQIKQHFTIDMIKNLHKMFMCGNYGDPAAGRHTLEIYRYFREINPDIVLGMNTNGSIQNTTWWTHLGKLFHLAQDYVVFSIDGLADTNHLYRRGVDWHKMMTNIRSYISTGARAHWDMLVYRHNQHQVDACQQLARDMGFSWFRAKVSKRSTQGDLALPVGWQDPRVLAGPIACQAIKDQSIYIDAQARVHACCWLGSRQIDFDDDWQHIQESWTSDRPNPVCAETCRVGRNGSSFTNQWQQEVALC